MGNHISTPPTPPINYTPPILTTPTPRCVDKPTIPSIPFYQDDTPWHPDY